MTQAMQQYAAQFGASQQAQQSAINAGLASALSNLGQRRDAVAKVAAGLPAQVTQAYNTAQGSQNAANAELAKLGGGGVAGGQIDPAVAKLINGQLAGGQAAGLASEPYLQAGITADYTKGADTLENQHLAAQDALNQQASDFALKMAELRMQNANKTQDYQAQADAGVKAKESLDAWELAHGIQVGPQTPADKIAEQDAQALDVKATKAGFANGAQLTAVENDPYYQAVVKALSAGKATLPNGITINTEGNRTNFLKQVAQSNQWTLRALAAEGLIAPSDFTAAFTG